MWIDVRLVLLVTLTLLLGIALGIAAPFVGLYAVGQGVFFPSAYWEF